VNLKKRDTVSHGGILIAAYSPVIFITNIKAELSFGFILSTPKLNTELSCLFKNLTLKRFKLGKVDGTITQIKNLAKDTLVTKGRREENVVG
jgi:hypothetical protein